MNARGSGLGDVDQLAQVLDVLGCRCIAGVRALDDGLGNLKQLTQMLDLPGYRGLTA